MKISHPSKLRKELLKLTITQILTVIKQKHITIKEPEKQTKDELINKIVKEYKFRKEWSEHFDHNYDFELEIFQPE